VRRLGSNMRDARKRFRHIPSGLQLFQNGLIPSPPAMIKNGRIADDLKKCPGKLGKEANRVKHGGNQAVDESAAG